MGLNILTPSLCTLTEIIYNFYSVKIHEFHTVWVTGDGISNKKFPWSQRNSVHLKFHLFRLRSEDDFRLEIANTLLLTIIVIMIKVLPTFLTIFFDKARYRSFWITGRPSVTVRLCWGRAGKPLFNHWISILLSKIIHFSEFLFMWIVWNEIEFTMTWLLFSSRPGHPDGACYYSDTVFINRDLATGR